MSRVEPVRRRFKLENAAKEKVQPLSLLNHAMGVDDPIILDARAVRPGTFVAAHSTKNVMRRILLGTANPCTNAAQLGISMEPICVDYG